MAGEIEPLFDTPERRKAEADRIAAFTAPFRIDDDGWRSMDSAPKDGTRILAYSPKCPHACKIKVTWWRSLEDQAGYVGWGEFNTQYWPATHWQPLPAEPRA